MNIKNKFIFMFQSFVREFGQLIPSDYNLTIEWEQLKNNSQKLD